MIFWPESQRHTSIPQKIQQVISLQDILSFAITVSEEAKGLSKLLTGEAESWSVVDVQLDKVLQVNFGDIVSCFSILAELHLIIYIFYLSKKYI